MVFFFLEFSKAPKIVLFFFMVFSKSPKVPKVVLFLFLVFFQNSMGVVFFFLTKTLKLWFFFHGFFQSSQSRIFFLIIPLKPWSSYYWSFPKLPKFPNYVLLILGFFPKLHGYGFFFLAKTSKSW